MNKKIIYASLIAAIIPLIALAQGTGQVTINPNLPGTFIPGQGPTGFVSNFYQFALLIAGILALGAIVYGGIRYAASAGNASSQSDAKEWIWGALTGLLLLGGAYIILYLINPNLTNLTLPTLPAVTVVSPAGPGAALNASSTNPNVDCNDLASVASQYNEAYPSQNAPDLNQEISCIRAALPGVNLGSQFTFDQTNVACNYTRGNAVCNTTCSHTKESCHYGGHAGTQGAEAVDLGNEKVGDQIIQAAYRCGAKSARCENGAGVALSCSAAGADHVHVSAGGCDAN